MWTLGLDVDMLHVDVVDVGVKWDLVNLGYRYWTHELLNLSTKVAMDMSEHSAVEMNSSEPLVKVSTKVA